jgi:hypothetical protein
VGRWEGKEEVGSRNAEGGKVKGEKLGRQIKERVALGAFHLKSASLVEHISLVKSDVKSRCFFARREKIGIAQRE